MKRNGPTDLPRTGAWLWSSRLAFLSRHLGSDMDDTDVTSASALLPRYKTSCALAATAGAGAAVVDRW